MYLRLWIASLVVAAAIGCAQVQDVGWTADAGDPTEPADSGAPLGESESETFPSLPLPLRDAAPPGTEPDADRRPVVSYALAEGPDGGALLVDDDLIVKVNGVEAFRDWGNGSSKVVISFEARDGDQVEAAFYDTAGWCRGYGETWLIGPSLPPRKIAPAWSGKDCNFPADPVHPFAVLKFSVP